MEKNVTLVKVTNWNSCSNFEVEENGEKKIVTSPARYLGLIIDSDDKIIPIGTFKDFHTDLLTFFAKSVVVGDKENPKFKPVKPKDEKKKKEDK